MPILFHISKPYQRTEGLTETYSIPVSRGSSEAGGLPLLDKLTTEYPSSIALRATF